MNSVSSRAAAVMPHSSGRKRSASCSASCSFSGQLERPHLGGAGRVLLAQRDAPPRSAASGCARRCGWPSNAMPNMSQTSRSYQLAAGQRSVMRRQARDARPRAAL